MLKIGLVGVGNRGQTHLHTLKQLQTVIIVGLYDLNPIVAAAAADTYQVTRYEDIDALIDDCDAIIIATPTEQHYEAAARVLKKSKHVFIEKPISHSIQEAKSLIALANEANVQVQIGHIERFNPTFLAAQPYCSNPVYIDSTRTLLNNMENTESSLVMDLMLHDLDIILNTVKSNLKRINASAVSVLGNFPDMVNARLEFDNGCVANLTGSTIATNSVCKTNFFKRDACTSIDFIANEVVLMQRDENAYGSSMEDKYLHRLQTLTGNNNHHNPVEEELRSFVMSVKNNTTPLVSIEDGYKALDVAHKIIDKIKSNAEFSDQ